MLDSRVLAAEILQIVPPIMRTLAAELRRTGQMLAPPHFGVLLLLLERPHNLSELAASQAVSLPTMSKTVGLLEARGWVRRTRSPQDRRVLIVSLTEEGQQILVTIGRQSAALVEQRMSGLSAAQLARLSEGLAVLCQIFDVPTANAFTASESSE